MQEPAGLLPFALSAWRIVPAEDASAVAEVLDAWWQTYDEKEVPIRIALGSLDRMLSEAEVAAV